MVSTESTNRANAVFLPEVERQDAHIVDVLIEERCPSFVEHFAWPVLRPILYGLLGYRRAVEMADLVQTLSGRKAFDHLAQELEFDMSVRHIERFPKTGKLIIAANHPTGLADGIAVWDVLSQVRKDVQFFANADAIRVSETFNDVIIPVEWVLEKRSPAKAKETLRRAKQALANEECIVIFPSGKLAQKRDGILTEQDWFSTVVTLARRQNCPVLPLNLKAQNSSLYYFLCKVNNELRDITLFYELLNKKGSKFDLTFGPMIQPDELAGDQQKVIRQLKDYVAYGVGDDADMRFSDWKARNSA